MRIRTAALILLLLGSAASPASGQVRIAVLTEPGSPIIVTEFLLAVGPADQEEGEGGLAYLSARSVVGAIDAKLDSLGAHASVEPEKDAISIAVSAAPDVWEEATRTVVDALFRAPPDSLSVVRERATLVAELRGRLANPADVAIREMDSAFFGATHPWGAPTIGSPESVGRLSFADVGNFLRDNFTPDRAFAAVVGPVERSDALAHLQPLLGSTFPAPVELIPFRPAERPVRRDYNSITSWISASWRFPETADTEALRFVAFLATGELAFSPSQRSVFNVWSTVEPRVGGGEIRIQMVVPPEEAPEWSERLEAVVGGLGRGEMPNDVFEGHLRRFRGERLLRLLAPEDRAHEAARQLLVTGDFEGLVPDLEEMTLPRVRSAARELGDPTVVLLGPILDN